MKTSLEIDRLKIFARIGVAEHERVVGNLFEITVRVYYPLAIAMENDTLDHTLDYSKICSIVRQEMNKPCKLIEHAAHRIHQSLISQYPTIEGGYIKLTKVTPPIPEQLSGASVIIEW